MIERIYPQLILLSSSNQKYQPYPLLSYFSVFVCLRCLLHHILSLIAGTFRVKRDLVFIIIVQFVRSANSRIRFGVQIVFVCLYITPSHYYHFANLSKDIELAWQIHFVECVSKIKHIFLSYPLYNIWGCVFSVYWFPLWWLRKYTPCLIVIIQSEIWTITHCLGFRLGHERMVCAVCLSIFLCTKIHLLIKVLYYV